MSIEQIREFYITGKPIKTDFGDVRFLSYDEYLENIQYLNVMSFNTLHIYYQYRKMFADEAIDEELEKSLEVLKHERLIDIVLSREDIRDAYEKIFELVLDKDIIPQIFEDENLFKLYRELVLDMQIIAESEVNPNPEIQEYIDASKEIKQQESEKQSFGDILSSIVVGAGLTYKEVLEMTVFQVYSTFHRISRMKAYDTSTLFATVPSDKKTEIESWAKHVNLFENEKAGMKMTEFNKKYGKLF